MKSILYYSMICCLLLSCGGPEKKVETVARIPKEYAIEQLFNNQSVSAAGFNTDESKVLLHNNKTGIYNLYELSIADTAATALTASKKESFFSIDYLPGSSRFIYAADKGGDENTHVYLAAKGDTSAKDLTPWPKSANSVYGWSDDKKSLFITSNKRNQSYFDLWKADTTGWNATLFYQNDSGYNPGLISSNERFIALTKSITTDKNEMYLYDRSNKVMKKISNDNEATWNPTGFEKNDSIFYYITNDGSEFSYLVKYNLNTGSSSKYFSDEWDVNYMAISEHEKYHTIFINADGKNKVLLFDHATNKPIDFPEIKDGDVKSVNHFANRKKYAAYCGQQPQPG